VHLATIWEEIAGAIPDEVALIHGTRTRTWGQLDERASRLAAALSVHGIGEGSKVALDLYNCPEYLEAFFATAKLNAIHVNVNYRYRHDELRQLLDDADAAAVIAHASLIDRVREVAPRLPLLRLVVDVHDPDADPAGSGYEAMVASAAPRPRTTRSGGMYLSYTGGTTGLPKGVMYDMAGVTARTLATRAMICGVAAAWEAAPADVAVELRDRGERPVALPASPLMHSTAFTFASLPALTAGGAIVTLENRRFDAHAALAAIECCRATVVAIVGDAFGRPLADALDERAAGGRPYDTSSLRVMCSAGVAWGADTKRRLLDHIPQLTLLDACGSTEGGTYGFSIVRRGDDLRTVQFTAAPGTIILDDEGRPAPAGQVGLIAAVTQTSGYFKHPEKSAETFRTIDGQAYVVPGDLGVIDPDGTITLVGRGSSVINTGGEKVHPEEVEEALRTATGVSDAIVVGVPDERLGQAVAAIVQRGPGSSISEAELVAIVRERLAGYKAPRRVVFVDEIPRSPNGKADLRRARELAQADRTLAATSDHRSRRSGEPRSGAAS
jgi:acyl-CoA synthetase (AMP-forming)/AMP-acid ligase II